jgi:hypothetical protein
VRPPPTPNGKSTAAPTGHPTPATPLALDPAAVAPAGGLLTRATAWRRSAASAAAWRTRWRTCTRGACVTETCTPTTSCTAQRPTKPSSATLVGARAMSHDSFYL